MPYSTIAELPDAVKKLPAHGQEIYQKAFNAAFEQYDGDEEKSAATAWTAVKTTYKQNDDGTWVAKEAASDSYENKRQLLQAALTAQYKLEQDDSTLRGVYIEDISDSEVIYNVNEQSYKASYTMAENGDIAIGEPEKVVRQTVYKSMESLQAIYAEIIQEAGKRNAILDAARVKKIVELCQELLSSEVEPEEKKAKEAIKEAKSTLKWLKEQAAVKMEDGEKYPASAYAYVPDADKPEGWKLRLWESLENKATEKQLYMCAASLGKGGYAGKRVTIPLSELSAVKRRIRAECRKIGVEEDSIPKWVREVETREVIQDYLPLTEAKFDKGRATVIVIQAGFNADKSRYYPKEMLQRDYGIFEGLKMYADHPTESEERERPERSIREWVATLKDVTCDESGTVTGVAEIIEPWLMQKLASLREKEMLSEMGISINAAGTASKATIDGVETLSIEKLERANSVDFVTEPGAGGIVTLYEADRNRNIDLVELATLKERRPDLVKTIEAAVRAEIQEEVRHIMEDKERITELEGQVGTLTTERDGLKETAEAAVKEKAKADAQASIKEAVDKAELPGAAKERIIERFKDAESAEGIEEAIKSEIAYIATLAESGIVKNLGPTTPELEKDVTALRESFKRTNPDWSDEQLEAAVTGR